MAAAKTRSGLVTFFLRVAGRDPVQLAEDQRFRNNLKNHEAQHARLSTIIEDIERINKEAKKKHEDLREYADSVRPPKGE